MIWHYILQLFYLDNKDIADSCGFERNNRNERILSSLSELDESYVKSQKVLSPRHFLVIQMCMQLAIIFSKVALKIGEELSGYEYISVYYQMYIGHTHIKPVLSEFL